MLAQCDDDPQILNKIAKHLITYGADVNQTDFQGNTPLTLYREQTKIKKQDPAFIKCLQGKNADQATLNKVDTQSRNNSIFQ